MKAFHSSTILQNGQAAVEMALLAPFLILILLGIIDFGRVMYFYMGVVEAARAGAQFGSQNLTTAPDTAHMIAAAQNDAPQGAGFTMSTPTAKEICECGDGTLLKCGPPITTTSNGAIPPTCTDIRIYVQVQTSGTVTTMINYLLFPSSFTLTGSSQMRAQ